MEGLTKESATCRIVVDIQSSKLYLHRRIQALLTARAHRTLAPYARTHAPYALTVRKFWWQNRAFCQQNQRFCQQNPGFWKQFCARSARAQCQRAVCARSACGQCVRAVCAHSVTACMQLTAQIDICFELAASISRRTDLRSRACSAFFGKLFAASRAASRCHRVCAEPGWRKYLWGHENPQESIARSFCRCSCSRCVPLYLKLVLVCMV